MSTSGTVMGVVATAENPVHVNQPPQVAPGSSANMADASSSLSSSSSSSSSTPPTMQDRDNQQGESESTQGGCHFSAEDVASIEASSSLETNSWPSSPAGQAPLWPPTRQQARRHINPTKLLDKMIDVATKAGEEESESSQASSSPSPSSFHLPDYVKRYRQDLKQTVGARTTPSPLASSPSSPVERSTTHCPSEITATSTEENVEEGQQHSQSARDAQMSHTQWKDHSSTHQKRPHILRALSEDGTERVGDDSEAEHREENDDTASATLDRIEHIAGASQEDYESISQGEPHTPKRKKQARSFGTWKVSPGPRSIDTSRGHSPLLSRSCPSPTPSDIMARRGDKTPSSSRADSGSCLAWQEQREDGECSRHVESMRDPDLDSPFQQQGDDTTDQGEAMQNVDDSLPQQLSQQQLLSQASYDGYGDEEDEDDEDEEEVDDDALESIGPVGFVTPRRKRTRSLFTPPPAPKSPTAYFSRRYIPFAGHLPGQSPSSLARRHYQETPRAEGSNPANKNV